MHLTARWGKNKATDALVSPRLRKATQTAKIGRVFASVWVGRLEMPLVVVAYGFTYQIVQDTHTRFVL
jgi:hypothetical protein